MTVNPCLLPAFAPVTYLFQISVLSFARKDDCSLPPCLIKGTESQTTYDITTMTRCRGDYASDYAPYWVVWIK